MIKQMFKRYSLPLAAIAGLAFAPVAQAQYYNQSSNSGDQVVGAIVGGTIGAVIGESVAGRGDNTEGAIAGALIGGSLGAAVTDNRRGYYQSNYYRPNYGYTRGYRTDYYRAPRTHYYPSYTHYRRAPVYRAPRHHYYAPRYRSGSNLTISIGNGGYYGRHRGYARPHYRGRNHYRPHRPRYKQRHYKRRHYRR